MRGTRLVHLPVSFKYSDINYITLGAVVEKLSSERLDDYARGKIQRR